MTIWALCCYCLNYVVCRVEAVKFAQKQRATTVKLCSLVVCFILSF